MEAPSIRRSLNQRAGFPAALRCSRGLLEAEGLFLSILIPLTLLLGIYFMGSTAYSGDVGS
jgi:hypothetical protein